MSMVNRGEYLNKIGRFHRVLEERARSYHAILPFNALPIMMVANFPIIVVFCVNSFVCLDCVPKILSPLAI